MSFFRPLRLRVRETGGSYHLRNITQKSEWLFVNHHHKFRARFNVALACICYKQTVINKKAVGECKFVCHSALR
jgi:hypothetical protein